MPFIYPPIKSLSTFPNAQDVTIDNVIRDKKFSYELGSYIIGKNKTFHGGINLKVPDGHAIQAVADGRIIAYRMTKDYQKIQTIEDGKSKELVFSNCFILIEHCFGKLDYVNLVNTKIETPYQDYNFYSLYMHLMPITGLNQQVKLPEWLVLDKQKNETLVRGSIISNAVPSFEKGFTKVNVTAKHTTTQKEIRISERELVTIDGKYYLNKPLEFYDTNTSAVNILDKFLNSEDVTVLTNQTAIPVKAGEILGFAGKSQGAGAFDADEQSFHFEIWAADKKIFENRAVNEYCSFINGLSSYTEKNSLFDNLDIRTLGYAYVKGRLYETVVFNGTKVNIRNRNCSRFKSAKSIEETKKALNISNSETYSSDADWLSKPENVWEIKQQSEFFNGDGSIKAEEVKKMLEQGLLW